MLYFFRRILYPPNRICRSNLPLARVGREIIEAVVLAAVVFMLLQVTVRNFRVEGRSMDPTLENGQYLLVNRLVYLQVDMERLARIIPFWSAGEGSSRHAIHAPKCISRR